jgi:hypothetical protein
MVTGDCFYVSEDPRSCIVEQRVDFAEFAIDAREGIFDGRKIADVAFETVSIVQFTFNGCEGGSMTRKERGPVTGFNEASRKCCAVSWACARYHGDPFFFILHFQFLTLHIRSCHLKRNAAELFHTATGWLGNKQRRFRALLQLASPRLALCHPNLPARGDHF